MKVITLILAVCLAVTMFTAVCEAQRTDYLNEDFAIVCGTGTAQMLRGIREGRRYFYATNESPDYGCRLTTWQITGDYLNELLNLGIGVPMIGQGKPLRAEGGWWEDDFNIRKGSWYVILSSNGAGATETPLSAFVSGFDRQ